MNYCEKCSCATEDVRCPLCGTKKLRPVREDDHCFLTECEKSYAAERKRVLAAEGIEAVGVPYGNGFLTQVALPLENERLYVRFPDLERAVELLKQKRSERDDAYLLARAIQFFAPGVPQVYYVGLLAGRNDLEQLERTREGRSINRHDYTAAEIEEALERPVVRRLVQMMRWRGGCPAFDEHADCEAELLRPNLLEVRRQYNGYKARLRADLATFGFVVEVREQAAYVHAAQLPGAGGILKIRFTEHPAPPEETACFPPPPAGSSFQWRSRRGP